MQSYSKPIVQDISQPNNNINNRSGLFKKVNDLFQQERYSEVFTLLQEVLSKPRPESTYLWLYYARSAYFINNYDVAEKACKQIKKELASGSLRHFDINRVLFYLLSGHILYCLGRRDEALIDYQFAFELDPTMKDQEKWLKFTKAYLGRNTASIKLHTEIVNACHIQTSSAAAANTQHTYNSTNVHNKSFESIISTALKAKDFDSLKEVLDDINFVCCEGYITKQEGLELIANLTLLETVARLGALSSIKHIFLTIEDILALPCQPHVSEADLMHGLLSAKEYKSERKHQGYLVYCYPDSSQAETMTEDARQTNSFLVHKRKAYGILPGVAAHFSQHRFYSNKLHSVTSDSTTKANTVIHAENKPLQLRVKDSQPDNNQSVQDSASLTNVLLSTSSVQDVAPPSSLPSAYNMDPAMTYPPDEDSSMSQQFLPDSLTIQNTLTNAQNVINNNTWILGNLYASLTSTNMLPTYDPMLLMSMFLATGSINPSLGLSPSLGSMPEVPNTYMQPPMPSSANINQNIRYDLQPQQLPYQSQHSFFPSVSVTQAQPGSTVIVGNTSQVNFVDNQQTKAFMQRGY